MRAGVLLPVGGGLGLLEAVLVSQAFCRRDASIGAALALASFSAETILEQTIAYCQTAVVDGKPLGKYQQVQFTLAEMATETRMNRALLDATIKGHMEGRDVICETMMSKYASSESLNLIIDRVLDLFGEYGGLEANPLARVFRDVRVITIFAGTTEIMKTIIAKSLGL